MAPMRPQRLTRLALAAVCACVAAAAQADSPSRWFQVRLQVLSACHVGLAPAADARAPGSPRMLTIQCSRRTPFAIDWVDMNQPQLTGTGLGMGNISARWPARDTAALPHTSAAPADAPTLQVAY